VARGTPAVLGTDCLHLGFRFWTQHTVNWDAPPPDQKKPAGAGPESIWDSTRGTGITAVDEKTGQPRLFCLARGIESLAYPADDVFPAIVEVTFVVEPDERRALKTELVEPMSESDPHAVVATTAGFEDPATVSPYLLIGSEWVRCKSKDRTRFTIAARGVRGTPRASHEIGTVVRAGTTFVMRAYVPAFRDDWSSMKDFLQNVRPR
jgi:hypothetical protein